HAFPRRRSHAAHVAEEKMVWHAKPSPQGDPERKSSGKEEEKRIKSEKDLLPFVTAPADAPTGGDRNGGSAGSRFLTY
ncbi:MAG: hypothetical protein SV429_12805, partial [Pseudomonadota bacterium]|nr:hypothetical protein [Pseudomonadota bacterium]